MTVPQRSPMVMVENCREMLEAHQKIQLSRRSDYVGCEQSAQEDPFERFLRSLRFSIDTNQPLCFGLTRRESGGYLHHFYFHPSTVCDRAE